MRLRRHLARIVIALVIAATIEAVAPAPGLTAEEEKGPICRKHGTNPLCNVPALEGCDPCETR